MYTTHGHQIPGTPVASIKPTTVARCGGPYICNDCSKEARSYGRNVNLSDRLWTPGEVAKLFRVDPKTVTRWASAGKITSVRTPGGHRRFKESEVMKFYQNNTEEVK